MAEESLTLKKNKQTLGTESRANPKKASKTSFDNICGVTRLRAGHATDPLIMGNSIQPLSVNGNVLKSEASTATKMSSNSSSERTFSEPGNPERNFRDAEASAGRHTVSISNQMSSGNANMLKSRANSAAQNLNSLSGSRDGKNNFWGTEAAGEHHNQTGCNQQYSRNATVVIAESNPANLDDNYPSSLRSSSTCTSYSLEISSSMPNEHNQSQPLPLQTPPESRMNDQNKQINPSLHSEETNLASSGASPCRPSAPNLLQTPDGQPAELTTAKVSQCTGMPGNYQIVTSKNAESCVEKAFSSIASGDGKIGAQPVLASQPSNPGMGSAEHPVQMGSCSQEKKTPEDEEDTFYAFVILHAQEDDEEAARLKARLERITSTTGATFAEDFAEPGRSTFSCVEDAINNSAFTMLLLTANFNTRLNEMNADSAIMNSIEKPHKYNTVIPLVPRDNSLTKSEMPMVLRTKVQMKERDNAFELVAKKVLNPGKLQLQKQVWKQEQQIRKQQEKQRWLREENKRYMDFNREYARVQELERQIRELQLQQQPSASRPQPNQAFSGQAQRFGSIPPHWPEPASAPVLQPYSGNDWSQPPSNIHIENAKYIIVGNNSTMTVGAGGTSSGDED